MTTPRRSPRHTQCSRTLPALALLALAALPAPAQQPTATPAPPAAERAVIHGALSSHAPMRISLPNGKFILTRGAWVKDRPGDPAASQTADTGPDGPAPSAAPAPAPSSARPARSFSITVPRSWGGPRERAAADHPGAAAKPGPGGDRAIAASEKQGSPGASKPAEAQHGDVKESVKHTHHPMKSPHRAGMTDHMGRPMKPHDVKAPQDRKPLSDPAVRKAGPGASKASPHADAPKHTAAKNATGAKPAAKQREVP